MEARWSWRLQGWASVLSCRGLVWEPLPGVHWCLLERSVCPSGADAVTLGCHCRSHRRRKDSHQQGPGGVSEPPADSGGSGHRGVHHPLHCQSEAGGDTARGWALVTVWSRLCTVCAGLTPSVPRPDLSSYVCSFYRLSVSVPLFLCSGTGQTKCLFLDGSDRFCLAILMMVTKELGGV